MLTFSYACGRALAVGGLVWLTERFALLECEAYFIECLRKKRKLGAHIPNMLRETVRVRQQLEDHLLDVLQLPLVGLELRIAHVLHSGCLVLSHMHHLVLKG